MEGNIEAKSMPVFFENDNKSALEAITEAQRIAFAPVVFQAVRLLRDKGILQYLLDRREEGATESEVVSAVNLSAYGVKVLLESGLGAGVCLLREGKYYLSKVGVFILNDKMTRVNMDFSQDICYKAMWHLEEAIEKGTPAGLKELGPWETIYQGLSILPEPAFSSWFNLITFILIRSLLRSCRSSLASHHKRYLI